MKQKNGFTLIELLAIIVILAIIAVITVPIILDIIDNTKRGAATDSAYGYKDAINKYYVTELLKPENQNLNLSGKYDVYTGGVLNGSGISNKEIPVSGDKPSAGELHYTNNTLQGGCLVIGDYQVIFDGDGVSSTIKGDCSDYNFGSSANQITMAEMCPGCKFIYNTTEIYQIGREMPPSSQTTENYEEILSSHTYFLGLIEDPSDPNVLERAFVCGIIGTTPFCLEGYDSSKWSDEANLKILTNLLSCNVSSSDRYAANYSTNWMSSNCSLSGLMYHADSVGYVDIGNNDGNCIVDDDGHASCS